MLVRAMVATGLFSACKRSIVSIWSSLTLIWDLRSGFEDNNPGWNWRSYGGESARLYGTGRVHQRPGALILDFLFGDNPLDSLYWDEFINPGKYQCPHCGRLLRDEEVAAGRGGVRLVVVCPDCGAECKIVA